ncbi:PREDICTED: CD209 antigen-like protein C [Poecilia mexicana]|uniref:CD209 antigen-like protein C n=1 Tax=Poecilia mexicana TaxID=48701 RepID=UPI00072EAFCF|nr:PREDICTED: CD209 antigen-like protein C [Poecilia mexicana]
MENIYANESIEVFPKGTPMTLGENNDWRKEQGLENSKKRVYVGVIIILGLLTTFLLAGLIYVLIRNHQTGNLVADFSIKLSSMTQEKDRLNANLTDMNEELSRLRQKEGCPAGWTRFYGSCYLVYGCGSWDEAREYCVKKNAHLVVINSAEEQNFVASYTEDKVWIGFNDKQTEGTWQWVDGSSLYFRFWWKNQPDNGGNGLEEDCALIRTDDLWNDLQCSQSLHWICEKEMTQII